MRTLQDIQGRCVITEDGHWIWRGSLRPDGRANIYAPDYTHDGRMAVQSGPRAVWHCNTGKPIPAGWRAYGTCDEQACCNPAHVRCSTEADLGAWIARRGTLKGKTVRILANRATGRRIAKLSPALIAEIQASAESGVRLAKRLGLSTSTVSKARRGESSAFSAAGVFVSVQSVWNAAVSQSLSQ